MTTATESREVSWLTCGSRCPDCGLGCNQENGHSGSHTDRNHSW
jgi:hypothetical protein